MLALAVAVACIFAPLTLACSAALQDLQTLRFSAPEGRVLNEFYRQGPVSAHLVLTPGTRPRLLVAFPAGNSGAAIWLEVRGGGLSWDPGIQIDAVQREVAGGRLRGIAAELTARVTAAPRQGAAAEAGSESTNEGTTDAQPEANAATAREDGGAQIDSSEEYAANGSVRVALPDAGPFIRRIELRQSITGSVRLIREYEDTGVAPAGLIVMPKISTDGVEWSRRRLDGAPGYVLSLQVLRGTLAAAPGKHPTIALLPEADGSLRLRLTALTGERPLTPIPQSELLKASSAPDARLKRTLAFLSYDQKLLAGSWRFDTYFGRDTLMSLRLLAPVLQPRVIEAGLTAVLARLNAAGEVAHEEDIGEFAIVQRRRAGLPDSDAPIYDYKMVDDDFMLAPVAAHYLLDLPAGRERAAAFLARFARSDGTFGARRARAGDENTLGARTARAEDEDTVGARATRAEDEDTVGARATRAEDEDPLGTSFARAGEDTAGRRLVRNLDFVVEASTAFAHEPAWQHLISLKPGAYAGNWRDSQDGLGGGRYPYDVNGVLVPAALQAIERLLASGLLDPYLDARTRALLERAGAMLPVWRRAAPPLFDVRIPADAAHAAAQRHAQRIGIDPRTTREDKDLRFRAVALGAQGRPVPIMNSDEGYALLFLQPASDELERIAETLIQPFPAGLTTPVGLLVANPAYAPDELRGRFGRTRYHGAVIWSWQQALFAAGIERQLARSDLTTAARTALERAGRKLGEAIENAHALRGSELWSWSVASGRYRIEPFGQRAEDETESNAAQLWSTVWLARGRWGGRDLNN